MMPINGIFLEPCSSQVPDLSLQISPPNCDSSFSKNRSIPSIDLSSRRKPLSDGDFTELSLAHPTTRLREEEEEEEEEKQEQNPFGHAFQSQTRVNGELESRPIKGIPVYPNRPFPFLALDKDPKMRFYHHQMPYFKGGLDNQAPFLNLGSSGGGASRFVGGNLSGGGYHYYNYYHHPHHQYGLGQEGSHHVGMIRSRFLSKIPAKRNMRAPRMRWTSSLHARFVHAVELLGGHESELDLPSNNLLLQSTV
ncbi:hypothetical protein M569_05725 [Genlisea aurea]|uniref:Uncharacterized protein n=1 Tax=Genlisea aurea TaxID=192259 RepID=S8E077_9LAMI|nr:hypothetical protein M569_05725 [Genlisea aurea]